MNDLQERLDRSFGDGPPLGPVHDAVRLGRRAQRRRRLGVAATGVAVVTATATGGVALAQLGTDRGSTAPVPAAPAEPSSPAPDQHPGSVLVTPPPGSTDLEDLPQGPLPRTADQFAGYCADATESSPSKDRLLFGADDPTLMAHATGPQTAFALYRSADGSHWGRCEVTKVDGGYWSTMSVFGDTGTRSRPPGTTSTDCRSGCPVQHSFVGVLPDEVDTVRVAYADGTIRTRQTNEGFVALTHTLSAADGARISPVIRRIQYLDDEGSVLAEYAAPGVAATSGVPGLEAYPARDDTAPLGFDQESGNYED